MINPIDSKRLHLNQNQETFWLPDEITYHIFEYVDTKNLLNCRLVIKQWHRIAYDVSFWSRLFFHFTTIRLPKVHSDRELNRMLTPYIDLCQKFLDETTTGPSYELSKFFKIVNACKSVAIILVPNRISQPSETILNFDSFNALLSGNQMNLSPEISNAIIELLNRMHTLCKKMDQPELFEKIIKEIFANSEIQYGLTKIYSLIDSCRKGDVIDAKEIEYLTQFYPDLMSGRSYLHFAQDSLEGRNYSQALSLIRTFCTSNANRSLNGILFSQVLTRLFVYAIEARDSDSLESLMSLELFPQFCSDSENHTYLCQIFQKWVSYENSEEASNGKYRLITRFLQTIPHPSYFTYVYLVANTYAKIGKYDNAIEFLNLFETKQPLYIASEVGRIRQKKALLSIQQGNNKVSVQIAKNLKDTPNKFTFLHDCGFEYAKLKDFKNAEIKLKEAQQCLLSYTSKNEEKKPLLGDDWRPKELEYYLLKARLLAEENNWKEAEDAMNMIATFELKINFSKFKDDQEKDLDILLLKALEQGRMEFIIDKLSPQLLGFPKLLTKALKGLLTPLVEAKNYSEATTIINSFQIASDKRLLWRNKSLFLGAKLFILVHQAINNRSFFDLREIITILPPSTSADNKTELFGVLTTALLYPHELSIEAFLK